MSVPEPAVPDPAPSVATLRLSPAAERLAVDRPVHWEVLLFARVLADEVVVRGALGARWARGWVPKKGAAIAPSNAPSWVQRRIAAAQEAVITPLGHLVNISLQSALGPPGVPGNAVALVGVARGVARSYERAIRWVLQVRGAKLPGRWRHVQDALQGFMDGVIPLLETWGDRIAHEVTVASARMDAGELEGPLTLDLGIAIEIPPVRMEQLSRAFAGLEVEQFATAVRASVTSVNAYAPAGVERASTPTDGFHIVVGAAPTEAATSAGGLSLAHDVRLVKAALLYADRVTLCSVQSGLVLQLLALSGLRDHERLELLDSVADLLPSPADAAAARHGIALVRGISNQRRPSPDERATLARIRRELDRTFADLSTRIVDVAAEAQAGGIVRALNSGLVDLHPFQKGPGGDGIVQEFVDAVAAAVTGGTAYPLLDDATGGLIGAMVREGSLAVPDATQRRGKSARLAAMLFDRLPSFESASVDELLDIRRALDGPLARFRAAMLKMSGTLGGAAWDKDFPGEAELLITGEIAPAVAAIEEAVRDNRLWAPIGRALVDKPIKLAGGTALSLLVSHLSALPEVVGAALGGAAALAPGVYDAVERWRERRRTVEQNQLYFYYRVDKDLQR